MSNQSFSLSPPPSTQRPAISAREDERLALEALMRSSPAPQPEDDNIDLGTYQGESSPPTQSSSEEGNVFLATSQRSLSLSLRNELANAKRRGALYKLHPYQHDMACELVKVPILIPPHEILLKLTLSDDTYWTRRGAVYCVMCRRQQA
jgi:hypothetical protein